MLLIAFTFLTLLYSLATPLFEAPDEVWHYAYVRWLAAGKGLPALDSDESGAQQQVAQPPLYYAAAALLSNPFDDSDLAELFWHNPGFGYQSPGNWPDNKNMLVHTAREDFPWRGAVLAVRVARLTSLLFGLLMMVATWGLARETFDAPHAAHWAAALVACVPQFVFLSGVVSNDAAAAALATSALWSTAHALRHGVTPKRAALTGALVGLAALTKVSAIALLPLITAALLWDGYARMRRPLAHLRPTLIFLLLALLVGGWWYARNGLLYQDPLALRQHTDTLWGRPEPASLTTLISELPLLYRSFWAAFGWGHVQFAPWVYAILGLLPLTALAGWGWRLATRRWPQHWPSLLLALLWCGGIGAALVQWMRMVEAPHGRLLFPALGAGALLLVAGWMGLPRAGQWLARGLLGGLAVLAWLAPVSVIRPAFAPPRLRAPDTLAPALVFDGRIQLRGVTLEQASAAPGEWIIICACWEALAPVERDYTVFVQVVDAEANRVGERLTYPGLGRFPSSLWPVGQAFCDRYRLQIEPWTPTPAVYDVLIGLYDAATGERLPPTTPQGVGVGLPVVAPLRIVSDQPEPLPPTHPLDYRLGESIRLTGYAVTPLRTGEPLTVTLVWEAHAPVAEDYSVFIHLSNEKGEQIAQSDLRPRQGRYPTWAWQPGERIVDVHILRTPESGTEFTLYVGLYLPGTWERPPVTGPGGPLPDGRIPLPFQP